MYFILKDGKPAVLTAKSWKGQNVTLSSDIVKAKNSRVGPLESG